MEFDELVFHGTLAGASLNHFKCSISTQKLGKAGTRKRIGIPLEVAADLQWTQGTTVMWAKKDAAIIVRPTRDDEKGYMLKGKQVLRFTVKGLECEDKRDCDHHIHEDEYLVIYLDDDPK